MRSTSRIDYDPAARSAKEQPSRFQQPPAGRQAKTFGARTPRQSAVIKAPRTPAQAGTRAFKGIPKGQAGFAAGPKRTRTPADKIKVSGRPLDGQAANRAVITSPKTPFQKKVFSVPSSPKQPAARPKGLVRGLKKSPKPVMSRTQRVKDFESKYGTTAF